MRSQAFIAAASALISGQKPVSEEIFDKCARFGQPSRILAAVTFGFTTVLMSGMGGINMYSMGLVALSSHYANHG